MHAVKVNRMNYQVKTNGYDIDEPEPGTMIVKDLNMNADVCCLGSKFMVLRMTSITADVYLYNHSYKTLYNVPIVLGATNVTGNITVNLFIMVVKKALY